MANHSINKTEFEIRTVFPKELEEAFAFVTDPMNFPEIHPLINNVIQRDAQHFICFETNTMLFFPYCFHYWITVRKNLKDQSVTIKSSVRKGVRIKLVFSMVRTEKECALSEKIEIAGSWLSRKILSKKMKKAHLLMFENLGKVLRTGTFQDSLLS